MSIYAVFGMSRHRAIEKARQELEPWHKAEKRPMTPDEYEAAVKQHADETMAGTRTIQLSEKFDAPQFAKEFLEIAKRYESRSLHIKAYRKTGEKNPKTGKEIMGWADV